MNQYQVTDYGVIAGSDALQTEAFQRVFDLCRENGGTIIIPAGTYRISGVRMWSDTTLILKSGAVLLGSTDCNDYPIFEVPEGVEMRSDLELITQYYQHFFAPDAPFWQNYRRAMISAYGEKNIAILGEEGAIIDGQDCYDPDGEEGYRGPHGIYLTNCENITLRGYTAQHNGNFMHQLDNCVNTVMENVTCLGGSDGIHLHCCRDTRIENCVFKTGDDCIAGINVEDQLVKNCYINTSCNFFRIGGCRITVEDCELRGNGYYPHRMTIVKSKDEILPREAGRHNTICLVDYFASANFPFAPSKDIVFRRCVMDNFDRLLAYRANTMYLQAGTRLAEMTLEDVTIEGIGATAPICTDDVQPFTLNLRRVKVSGGCTPETLVRDEHGNTIVNVME